MSELLIKHLNEQLVSEYEAIFDYLFYSCRVKNDEIRDAMEDFSRQELEHARMLIYYVVSLGGEPVFIMPEVNQEQDEIQVLIKSIAAEESAVKKYTMIQQIIIDPEHKEIIGRTIEVEKAHHRELNEILNRVKEFYKGKRDEREAQSTSGR
jgi:rubrerythrin